MSMYTCEKCSKEFTTKSSYTKHINKKTPCKNIDKSKQKEIINIKNNNIDIKEKIKNIIKNNSIFVNEINQILHNEGININERLDIIILFLNKLFYNNNLNVNLKENVIYNIDKLIQSISIDKEEIYQIIFMFYCNKKIKIDLDQFYTPFTIGKFLSKLMIPNKSVIDPACGTGDLIKNYEGVITLWDVNKDVINICKENYNINNKTYDILCLNSIEQYNLNNNTYDYCCLNPPFGSSTVIKDKNILSNYILGKNSKSQEIGILFIERSINLLKNEGIAFIIVPNGYLGNSTNNIIKLKNYIKTFRIIGIIELPQNTFSRSGTGVSTSLIIIQKINDISSYNIFIEKINNIGYNLNKKNTPYKYKTNEKGNYIINNNNPVLDDDLIECYLKLSSFIKNENINNFNILECKENYEYVNITNIQDNILDINRYLNKYKDIINKSIQNNFQEINSYIKKNYTTKFNITNEDKYLYLDIKQISTPLYNKDNYLYGYELPGRAKINVMKNDIIISRLKGKLTFTIILNNDDNIICSNGFIHLRPKNYNSLVIIFANLFNNEIKIQHNSLCTGSIMEGITDDNFKKILIDPNIDYNKYNTIINSLNIINDIL